MVEYNEDKALFNYVLFYYSRLLDDFERQILEYRAIRRKRPDGEYESLLEKSKIIKDEKLLLPFIDDENFEQHITPKVMNLIKRESDRIEINRCPKCNKIARTNKAKQCRYCGFDWH